MTETGDAADERAATAGAMRGPAMDFRALSGILERTIDAAREAGELAELLGEAHLAGEQRCYLDGIVAATTRGAASAAAGLDLIGIATGSLGSNIAPIDVVTRIEDRMKEHDARASARGGELAFSVDPGFSRHVVGDPDRVDRALDALLTLATSLLDADGPAEEGVHVTLRQGAPGMARCEVHVLGSTDVTSAAEDPLFFAIRMLARHMGGEAGLSGDSRNRLHVELPLVPATGRDSVETPAQRPHPLPGTGRRALVCDDNPASRHALTTCLEALGFGVLAVPDADSALAALTAFDDGGFDLAILDEHMPETDGLELCRCIRLLGRRDELDLVLTGHGHATRGTRHVARYGFQGALPKPITPERVARTINRLLGGLPDPADPEVPLMPDGRRRPRVLVAEGNQVGRLITVAALRMADFEVDDVADGLTALESANERAYDLVIVARDLPELDGPDLVRRLRTASGASSRARLVAVGDVDDTEAWPHVRIDYRLTRPLDQGELVAVARACTHFA